MPPKPVDIFVGQRLRQRRDALGLSQIELAAALDLSFQQIQKYERGINRVSASTLFEAARFLQAPVGYFFDGYETEADDVQVCLSKARIADFWASQEGRTLANVFMKIKDSKVRANVLGVLTALADD